MTRPRLAAIVPNVLGFSPGQRVRIETWAAHLEQAGWTVEFFPFEDDELHEILYSGGKALGKLSGLARCFVGQTSRVLAGFDADVILIYREASLVGPAILERLVKRHNTPIVFDLDDPIFIPYKSPANNWASLLKFSRKTYSLFKLADHITAINHLIADHAAKWNPNVSIVPNCVDTSRYRVKEWEGQKVDSPARIVWVGSLSTMQNLAEIVEPIRRLQARSSADLLVIGPGRSDLDVPRVEFREWAADREVGDLRSGDIGVLPVNDLPWNNWKSFFKLIQYMAVGLPVVARDIGSNSEVITNGVEGFLVNSDDEWVEKLEVLANDAGLRERMGRAARRKVEESYSLQTEMERLVALLNGILARRRV